MQLFGDEN
jgi:hypothetical protein